ncbi:uncharacterized protein EI97DRAFT_486220 [Westerdykella ornata]|uniref:F-box domain-containing protein n=1 Tax=Westerdykella ornata TaxID=318751 RepID=A0A6A6JNI5_WESOR|nr:uncharacterized protein EI97DRAFT_486220 [Westerdykella ornata]KAF2278181.1 hypothetical protein EI97DRAFT_486220 [Westerdykella ornata]
MQDEGGDLDIDALQLSKVATPPLRWMRESEQACQPRPRELSKLEKLPAEIRHKIFSYLGIPEGSHIWIDCHGNSWECGGRAHPPDTAGCQHRYKVLGVTPKLWWSKPISFKFECGAGSMKYYIRSSHTIPWALLRVCKSIRSELIHLLFHLTPVELRDEVGSLPTQYYDKSSERLAPSAFNPSTRKIPALGYATECFPPPAWLILMTKIHLVGSPGTTFPLHMRRDWRSEHRRLTREAETLLFIADHCPELVELQTNFFKIYRPLVASTEHNHQASHLPELSLQSLLDIAVQACLQVVAKCSKLEKLVLEDGFKEWLREELLELDLKGVPMGLREELAERWLRRVSEELADSDNDDNGYEDVDSDSDDNGYEDVDSDGEHNGHEDADDEL